MLKAVTFSVPPNQIAALKASLNSKQLDRAVYQAISRTTKRAKTFAVKAVQAKLTIPRRYIDDPNQRHSAIRMNVSTGGDQPIGKVIIRETQVPLGAFRYRQSKRGVTVTIDKTQTPLFFRHAFTATVQSKRQEELGVSHTGIFVRQKVIAAKADAYFAKGRLSKYKTAKANAITPKGYAWRLPIAELFGPTILDFISRNEIRAAILSQIGGELSKQLASQLSRFTKGQITTLPDPEPADDN